MQRHQKKRLPLGSLPECEWNFTPDKVPDAELVACCLWEYARESAKLRELRQQCEKACRADGHADSVVPVVAGNIRHSNNSVEVFLREIVLQCPYDVWPNADPKKWILPGSGFPNPWQELSQEERARRASYADLKMKPYLAFQRGRLRDAQAIVRTVMEQRKVELNPSINPLTVSWIATHSRLVVQPTDWKDEDRLPAGFFYPDGTEVSVVEIDWTHFTNKEIGEWVGKHRPASIPEPKDRGGHKRGDWRATLERLGLLRLRSRYKVEKALATIAGYLTPAQRNKVKFVEPGECNREANIAVKDFHELLPFLASTEMPLSWPPK